MARDPAAENASDVTDWHWVPAAVRAYGDDRSRADGLLDLTLAPVAGRTRLTHAAHRMPVQTQRAQYLDPGDPAMAFVPLLSVGGGILQGDRIVQTVRLVPDARAHLTTPAATKVYRMERGYAATDTTLTVGDGATLEYLPAPVIVQRGARYAQRVRIVAAPGATVLYGDVLIPGRVAMGESGVYEVAALITEQMTGPDGAAIWRDALVIAPAALPPSAGVTETIGTLIAITTAMPAPDLADTVHAALTSEPTMTDVYWGVSDLPGGTGVIVRIAGAESRAVQASHHAAWHLLRPLTLGHPAPMLRRT